MNTLSRYERIRADFEAIWADLKQSPLGDSEGKHSKPEFSNQNDEFVWSLWVNWNRVAHHSYLDARNESNQRAVMKIINDGRAEKGLKPIKPSSINSGSSSIGSNYCYLEVRIRLKVKDYCEMLGIPFEIYRDESEIPELKLTGKTFLCRINRHKYEEEPGILEFVKSDGIHFFFFSSGIQKGIKRCLRCGHQLPVYRSGICGIGGIANKWRPMSPEQEASIDALPRL